MSILTTAARPCVHRFYVSVRGQRDIDINEFVSVINCDFVCTKLDSQTSRFSIKINLLFFLIALCCVHKFMQFENIFFPSGKFVCTIL